jgi:translation initiation factor 2A
MENKNLKKVPTYEGPVHDVAWNPNSEEFIVISGFMPAASVLFDKACTPIFEFGKHHRNTIRWSPLSNLVILGGLYDFRYF